MKFKSKPGKMVTYSNKVVKFPKDGVIETECDEFIKVLDGCNDVEKTTKRK